MRLGLGTGIISQWKALKLHLPVMQNKRGYPGVVEDSPFGVYNQIYSVTGGWLRWLFLL